MDISLSPFAPENLVSRDGFGSPVPRQPAHLHTQAESGDHLWDSSRFLRRRLFILTAIRHRVSLPQGSYGCCLAGHHGPINMRLSVMLFRTKVVCTVSITELYKYSYL